MTPKQLYSFLVLCETMNFTAAADRLGYAQSTVTTQIKQLEEELQCSLFDRLGKSLSLTSAGKRLLPYAKEMTHLESTILSEVPDDGTPCGELRIGLAESLCYGDFPKILAEYKKEYPNVTIDLKFIDHNTYPSLLKEGVLDFVYTIEAACTGDNLIILHEKLETLGFYVASDHPLAKKKGITDLNGQSLLLTGPECNFRMMLLSDLTEHGINYTIDLSSSSKAILKMFAAQGNGIAFLPDISANEDKKNHALIRLDWLGHDFKIYSHLLIHKDKTITTAMKLFFKKLY